MTDSERPSFRIVPIPHVDVYEAVLGQLKDMVAGLDPGDRLPAERELAERFGVSRVSLRAALRSLESMGRIDIRRNAGSFVVHPQSSPITGWLKELVPVNGEFLNHLVEVRASIEDRVLILVHRASPDYGPLATLLDTIEHGLDAGAEQTGSLDVRFESLLGRMSGNPLLTELQKSAHELWVDAWGTCGIAPGDPVGLLAEHRRILDALTRGDIAQARAQMATHVDRQVTQD
jgi:GntR family transcriptional repressor for pyruvate dehydrogenase complex